MIFRRFWPKSLVGQIALLVAIALFVAQSINFALLLQGGRSLRQAQITGPSVARLIGAVERDREGGIAARNRSIRLMSVNPIPAGAERLAEVEAAVARGFAEAGRPVPPVIAAIRGSIPDRWTARSTGMSAASCAPAASC